VPQIEGKFSLGMVQLEMRDVLERTRRRENFGTALTERDRENSIA
jgi:hypothetical protein